VKIYFAYIAPGHTFFRTFEVSESVTAEEVLQFKEIQEFVLTLDHPLILGVNGELLDGQYKALPANYRMSHGERLELYRGLIQDPKERRRKKAESDHS